VVLTCNSTGQLNDLARTGGNRAEVNRKRELGGTREGESRKEKDEPQRPVVSMTERKHNVEVNSCSNGLQTAVEVRRTPNGKCEQGSPRISFTASRAILIHLFRVVAGTPLMERPAWLSLCRPRALEAGRVKGRRRRRRGRERRAVKVSTAEIHGTSAQSCRRGTLAQRRRVTCREAQGTADKGRGKSEFGRT